MEKYKEWLTLEDLHKKWDVSYGTIKKWREQGLPCYQVGKKVRFIEHEVIDFLREYMVINPQKTSQAYEDGNGRVNEEAEILPPDVETMSSDDIQRQVTSSDDIQDTENDTIDDANTHTQSDDAEINILG